ncbi:MAG TPA: amidohydrolase family protein, partial [Candidatus Sulfopaludibacter sp.]|nr:amidohydrolase family protein [Candidatus Sulfopaludibacter sp.]
MRTLLMGITLASTLAAQPYADLILTNGRIWTVNAAQPRAEAVACLGNRIAAVGTVAEIAKWAGPQTQAIDLGGKMVVPGFNDAHVHFFIGGQGLASVQLRDARSEAEFADRIRRFAANLPKGRWILRGDWDHESWTPARLPTRQLIDEAAGEHPVFVNRLDGHMALANSAALKLAGVTRKTPDPPGGAIVRDAAGEPTGILKDAAMSAVERVMPDPADDELAGAVRAALRYAAENGVTSVQDMSASPEVLRVYQRLLRAGELTVRISGDQPLAAWRRLADAGILAG